VAPKYRGTRIDISTALNDCKGKCEPSGTFFVTNNTLKNALMICTKMVIENA
jgi:hypothetical protein